MCYDAPDFAVAVVDFRMSMASGYKLMDATLRFVNKTNQPLILGYLDGSAVALDDQGNRYAPYGNRGLAGIGLVNGNSADPKFVLQPGGAGDARWELLWRPGPQDPIGSAFDLSMTIREVNTLVGGQHALGGETPLRFQGLANGMVTSGVAPAAGTAGVGGVAGASPMLAGGTSGLPACGPSGNAASSMTAIAGAANSVGGPQTANATNTATNTAGNAMSQLAGLKSIFGKKNAAPATSASGANCIPTATANAMPAAAGTSTAPAAAGQAVTAAPAAAPAGAAPAGAVPGAVPATAGKPAADPRVTNAVATRGALPATAVKATVPVTGNAAASSAAARPAAINASTPNTATAPNAKPAAPPATAKPAAPAPAKNPAATAPAKKPAAASTTTNPSK